MPTPVVIARQCLTPDAALALADAVSVARRRSHAQTTSLHAVSSLLSLPSSPLREACTRARNSAYSCRIQFKALELCLGVSLDRLPSSEKRVDEPPVSNSLMAAIKRSQANQRRQPENFQFYHQQQLMLSSSSSSVSIVKVELQNMILAILDDPVVSRVFGDAGFRSCDIKLALLRPVHQLLRYKGPPVFMCNLIDNSGPGRQGFSFPFSGVSRTFDNDEIFKKIAEILARKNGRRNPLLVGVCANDVLKDFLKIVQKGGVEGDVLPSDLSGFSVICIETEVSKFISGDFVKELLKLRFEEVEREVENCIGGGVILNFGDLKVFVDENGSMEAASFVVVELARLMEIHDQKLWLIGTTARHESYLEFLNKFPSIEKDWKLQFLPLTSSRPPMGETHPRSSLMESFVPFGGFFSTPSIPFSGSNQYITRCHLCNEECKQEVAALVDGGFSASVSDPYQSSSPSWLEMTGLSKNRELDDAKAKSSSVMLSTKVEKKWDSICQLIHQAQPYTQIPPKTPYKFGNQVPSIVGFQVVEGRKVNFDHIININNASSSESGCEDKSCRSMDLQNYPTANTINQSPKKMAENPSKIEEPSSLSSSSVADNRTSPMTANSVTTDLELGVNSASLSRELVEPTHQVDMKSSSNSYVMGRSDQKDFKMLYKSLSTRIGRQEEAVLVISQTIARCRTKNDKRQGSRSDLWFIFVGPDKSAKRKIAVSLAETLYGSRENFISVDLSLQDSVDSNFITFNPQEMKGYDVKSRGKTVVDYIAEELAKKPLSVVFLKNIDKADLLSQSHLSRALKTGKFSNSHGREVSISNALFVATSQSPIEELGGYSEEDVLRSNGFPFQMLIGFDLGDVLDIKSQTKPQPVIMNKRKLVGVNENLQKDQSFEIAKRAHKKSNAFLDLNLPAEENENSEAWMDDFLGQVDEKVIFKPLDFDDMAKKIMKEISECFHKTIGSVGLLEIDSKVIDQMVAAACLLEKNAVEDWVDEVLGRAFSEAQKRYTLSSRTVVKLVTCEGVFPEEKTPGILLPARIIMN